MPRILTKARTLLRSSRVLLPHNVIKTIRAATDDDAIVARWWTQRPNWGDALNPVLVHHLSGRWPFSNRDVINLADRPVFSVIGSMLDASEQPNLEVWGSGFRSPDGAFVEPPARIHAVRGPLTRDRCLRQGLACPAVFGDPALLYPRFYHPVVEPRYELGIIPHYVDRKHPWLARFADDPDVTVIDVFCGVQAFVRHLLSCRAIASSSLHGLIAADAYGIPSAWLELSGRVLGSGFKFRDYFASVGRADAAPLRAAAGTTVGEIRDRLHRGGIEIDLDALLAACPFRRDDA